MIKTLKITSILVVVLAVASATFPIFFAGGGDKETEDLLNTPSPIEKFRQAKDKGSSGKDQVSPLVEQAKKFALYLNPPKPVKARAKTVAGKLAQRSIPKPKSPVSTKFKLIATSYYASHPELSLALIDEPGKGYRWVRQSGKIGHLVLTEVENGRVVVSDGKNRSELIAERLPKISLLKSESLLGAESESLLGADSRSQLKSSLASFAEKIASGEGHAPGHPEPTPQESFDDILAKIAAMRVNLEEADNLRDLGKKLTNEDEISSQPQAKPRRTKIARPPKRERKGRTRKTDRRNLPAR